MEEFDYIIVGAGSAGCVLADRLSAGGRHRVLVLEAGGSDARLWIKVPIGYGLTFADARVNWKYETLPSPGLGGRRMYWPRGRVLGGSSSINAMVYCRGMPEDFEDWRALGNEGWGWAEVRAYFERSERRVAADGRVLKEGPLDVKSMTPYLHPMRPLWLAAATELGLPVTEDFNGAQPEGFGCYEFTIRDGRRWSAADAFLRPAVRRGSVKVETGAWARQVRFDGRRAVAVEYAHGDEMRTARAAREVILSCGAINSPQLLQLSGIGPAHVLRSQGITPLIDNPAVGGHLQDHLGVTYYFKATQPTLNERLHSLPARLAVALEYLATRRGPAAMSVNQFGGFVRSVPQAPRPNLQLYCAPVTYGAGDANRKRIRVDPFPGFYLCFQPTRPTSEGRIDVVSPDFRMPPAIAPNYLATEQDQRQAVQGGRLLQAIARTRAIGSMIAAPLTPDLLSLDEAGLLEDFRARAATVYHPVGTCRMGRDARDSVVDASLRVHGIEGLRVVDASVFPTVTSANTHAPTLMVAQKAADLILAA